MRKTSYLVLQRSSQNQLVHPLQNDLAVELACLGLVLGFGEGDLMHDGNEHCAVDDDHIIADSEGYSAFS